MNNAKRIAVKVICPGDFSAPALITRERISLLGGADAEHGMFCDPRGELNGKSFANKVLIFTSGKGSSLWSTILGTAKRLGTAPAAIINLEIDTFVVFACVVCDIPMLQLLDQDVFSHIKNDDLITFNLATSKITVA
jgi:predicted aconitase with swiveling domain